MDLLPEHRQVLTKATLRAADRLGLNETELAQVLERTPAAISRFAEGQDLLGETRRELELATLLIRLYVALSGIFQNDETEPQRWMRRPNEHLNAIPTDRITTMAGLERVVGYVESFRVGQLEVILSPQQQFRQHRK